ncbi:hypothetical protein BI344_17335 [Chromobacterium sphagni]|uniref:HAMP domain-containing protein n=2 Tax=Chromobacterium sphagni TaxID=1903179 RepID=A0ABX3CBQ9_9NEIS|nr:hypothetical protein BI344_17335 [Chromobacterium sphagni]
MNRLRYPQKFALIGLVAALAVAAALFGIYAILNRQITIEQREIAGTELFASAQRALQQIQLHRGLCAGSNGGSNGGSIALRQRLRQSALQVDMALAAVNRQLRNSGDNPAPWQRLQDAWRDLKPQCGRLPPAEDFNRHSRLIDQLQRYSVTLADEYAMTLDPVVDSYYLLETAVNKYPDLLEQLAQLRGMGTGALSARSLTPQQTGEIQARLAVVAEARRHLQNNIATAARFNPAIAAEMQNALDQTNAGIRVLHDALLRDVLDRRFATTPEHFFDRTTRLIDVGYQQLFSIILPTARNILEQRIRHSRQQLWLTLAGALLILLLLAYLFCSAYYAMISNISDFSAMAGRIASGELDGRVELSTRDELQDIAAAFNQVTLSLAAILTRSQRRITLNLAMQQARSIEEMGLCLLHTVAEMLAARKLHFDFRDDGAAQLLRVASLCEASGQADDGQLHRYTLPMISDGETIACLELETPAALTEAERSALNELQPGSKPKAWRSASTISARYSTTPGSVFAASPPSAAS